MALNNSNPVMSVYDVPEDGKVVLFDNQRGRLLDKPQKGYMVHIILENGSHLITDPGDIEAYIGKQGWVNVTI